MNTNMTALPLKDIHLPDPISFWPLAFGWWIVAGIVIFLIFLSLLLFRKLSETTLKSEAKNKLQVIEKNFLETDDALVCLTEISALLRRITLSQKATDNVAGLTGEAWLQFLDQPLKTAEFSQGAGQILLTGPYSLEVDKTQVMKLIQLSAKWVNVL